ncbi:MAG TPA: PKD domain-containing protein, partial [Caldilineaceae bacterium]|nr:PKD domain-containing protein [Caldilineaceae bacterium]
RFRISLVQGDSIGPVKQGSAAAVSPPFRVRGTTCVWPRGLSFRLSKANPNPQESVTFTGLLVEGTGIMTFTWDFGDGSPPVSGQRINHAYYYGGPHTVRVTATGVGCPVNRSLTITADVQVQGGPPLFLPLVFAGGASRAAAAERPLLSPGPVESLAGQMDSSGLLLSWTAPAVGGPVASYRVYASRGGGEFVPVGVTDGERTNFLVRTPDCGAAWLVAAVGPGGEGPASRQSYLAPACPERGGGQ